MISNTTKKAVSMVGNLILQQKFATKYVASIDQSTTSTKFSIFEPNGKLIDKQIIQHTQITPHDGWLQHDPMQILKNTHSAMQTVINRLQSNKNIDPEFDISKISGVGICNQRETIICWDQNGKPLYNAIVWCDSRTKQICQNFTKKYGDFKLLTGLPVSPYFSLFKMIWLAQSVPEVKERLANGKIKFGTIDSWLIYNLTGKYVTDASNASRTYLCNLNGQWDQSLLKLFKIKKQFLPEIISSFETVGSITNGILTGIPICSVLGDQQSSAFAHGLKKNQMKITYGTGCFLLANIGSQPEIHDSFVTTILNKKQKTIQYGYQASVQCGGGTVNWAKKAGFLTEYDQLNNLKRLTTQQVFFYPSFGSIYAPFWKSGVKGAFSGLNFSITKPQILQSILQSITFRLYDNIKQKQFQSVREIIVDGGMTVNKQFMQFQADVFNKIVRVSELDTCWGVAKGVLINKNIQFNDRQGPGQVYTPNPENHKEILQRYNKWTEERNKIYGWKKQ